MFNKISLLFSRTSKLSLGLAGIGLLFIAFTGNVSAATRCPGTVNTNLNSTVYDEYAVNDNCRDIYIHANNYQSYVNKISFEANDFNSNYVMEVYYQDANGMYYMVQGATDVNTRDGQNCSDYKNITQPAYGVDKCFMGYSFNINRSTSNILIRTYTMAGKNPNSNHYAYYRNFRIDGYSTYNPTPTPYPTYYPTYTPTPYPTYTPTPYPTYYYAYPNLLLENLRFSTDTPNYNQNINISVDVRNKNGNESATGFYIRMYRNNTEIANKYYNSTLYSGQGFTWDVNNVYVDSGTSTIKVVVDPDNRIRETNENDNQISKNVYKNYNYYTPLPAQTSTPTPYYPYPQVLGDNVNIYINGNCNNVVVLSDINTNRYYGPIYAAACEGITHGYNDNSYRPNSYITRAEFISMLVRAFPDAFDGYVNCSYFNDVEQGTIHWYNIQRARCSGITRGYNNNTFRPNSYISYGEAASILYNVLRKYDYGYNVNLSYQPYFMQSNSPHYDSVYYLSNMNPYSTYPVYDYQYNYSMQDGNYAQRGWIANSIVAARAYI
jgi:hypothetical protein